VALTAYNPRDCTTLLKCAYLLSEVAKLELTEAGFRAWLRQQDGGKEVADRLDAGWQPQPDERLTVDPLNAEAETAIVSWLKAEASK